MYNFQDLLKQIRKEGNLTQEELARALDVSTILISMIETGQKEVSKNFVEKLAERLDVRPSSIAPFVFVDDDVANLPALEKKLISLGEQLQTYLIKTKSKRLKKYVET
jgi:transcriptional regulator with XRE-family HTH domain